MGIARISIGIVPHDESCAQTGRTANHYLYQTIECAVFRAALIGRYGPPPTATEYQIRTHIHEFGSYRELDLVYDPVDPVATAYAESVEDGLGRWSDGGMIAPVRYDEQYQATMDVPSENAAAQGAIVRLTQLIRDGYGTETDRLIVDNLRSHYVDAAIRADATLAEMGIPVSPVSRGVMSWAG